MRQKVARARLGLDGDLVPRERDAGEVARGGGDEVGVAWVLVADLQLAPLRVGFHEEAALDVEQDGEVLEQRALFGRHLDVRERPRCGAQLVFHVQQSRGLRPVREDRRVGRV